MDVYSLEIREDKDILAARDRARVISEELGYDITQQLQISTSVFELGKNILEHGKGGGITFAISSSEDVLSLEVTGHDNGPGLTDDQIHDLLTTRGGAALRGIPAMKRMMDSVEIVSDPGHGTTIRMVKRKPHSTQNLARNIVSYLNKRFSSRKEPTISEELRKQNQNLVQTLSLYEEKNQELQEANRELLLLKQQLEKSNEELQLRTTELQEAILSLGDRTSEVEAQNRRFSAVLQKMSEGVVITDRSGVVTHANENMFAWLDLAEDEVVNLGKQDWFKLLGGHLEMNAQEWNRQQNALEKQPQETAVFSLRSDREGSPETCRVSPILDRDGKMLGRIWLFE